MILDHLIPMLEENFLGRKFIVNLSAGQVVFPAVHPKFGDLEIQDEGSEIILYAGNFSHCHYSNYEDHLSENEKQKRITEDVVAFLKTVFSDQLVFWGSHRGGGGWYQRGQPPEWTKTGFLKKPEEEFVWSGPLQ